MEPYNLIKNKNKTKRPSQKSLNVTHTFFNHNFNAFFSFLNSVQICKICNSVAVLIPSTHSGLSQSVLFLGFVHGHVEREVTPLHIYFTDISVVCRNVVVVNVSSEGAHKT